MNTPKPSDQTNRLAEEPKCLISPESKWYRPGQGFTCRQIMLPLLIVALLLAVMVVVQGQILLTHGGQSLVEWGQFVVPIVMLGLVIRAVLFVRQSLLDPLTQVRHWVSRVRSGDLTARMPSLATGEFNELARDINGLARLMEALHNDLESEVDVKTENLARKTLALELLYEVVTSTNEDYDVNELLLHFMRRLGEVYSADAAVVRILEDSKLTLIGSYGLNNDSNVLAENVPIRFDVQNSLFGKGQLDVRSETINESLQARKPGQQIEHGVRQIISIPLQYRDSILGSYQLFVGSDTDLDDDAKELLVSVGQHLGVAVEQSRLDQDAGKLMMVEERARLANELHDSLAQTLASLRFQVRVLDETLHQDEEQVIWEELEKLESKVEEANHELRSLIAQFRAPLQSQEVVISVEKLIRKFRKDTGIAVFFQNEWQDDELTADMRTDVIRIIQEALANIKKHADAHTVRVLIRHQNNRYRIMVEDDGAGFDDSEVIAGDPGEHIGKDIMMERARRLGSELKIDSEPGEGTLVSLEFDCADSHEAVPMVATG
ncbi:MAG: histidine kinase [Gammaproteobacteria bacterium]